MVILTFLKSAAIYATRKYLFFHRAMHDDEVGELLLNATSFLGWHNILAQLSLKNENACAALGLISTPSVWARSSSRQSKLISTIVKRSRLLSYFSQLPPGCCGHHRLWSVLVEFDPTSSLGRLDSLLHPGYEKNVSEVISDRILIMEARVRKLLENDIDPAGVSYFAEFFEVVNISIGTLFERERAKILLAISRSIGVLPKLTANQNAMHDHRLWRALQVYFDKISECIQYMYGRTDNTWLLLKLAEQIASGGYMQRGGTASYIRTVAEKNEDQGRAQLQRVLDDVLAFCKGPGHNKHEIQRDVKSQLAGYIESFAEQFGGNEAVDDVIRRGFADMLAAMMSKRHLVTHDNENAVYGILSRTLASLGVRKCRGSGYRNHPRFLLKDIPFNGLEILLANCVVLDISRSGILVSGRLLVDRGSLCREVDSMGEVTGTFTVQSQIQKVHVSPSGYVGHEIHKGDGACVRFRFLRVDRNDLNMELIRNTFAIKEINYGQGPQTS